MCRIEEEEFDKYSIPSKSDSDKYKVIRTFSFLKNRMTSTRNKSKVTLLLQSGLLITQDSRSKRIHRQRVTLG